MLQLRLQLGELADGNGSGIGQRLVTRRHKPAQRWIQGGLAGRAGDNVPRLSLISEAMQPGPQIPGGLRQVQIRVLREQGPEIGTTQLLASEERQIWMLPK